MKGDTRVEQVDCIVGRSRFVGTVIYVEDPEIQEKVENMIAGFIVQRILSGNFALKDCNDSCSQNV